MTIAVTEIMTAQASPTTTLAALRRLLLGLLMFGLAGTSTDLLLMGHYEDEWQLIPFATIGLAFVATASLALMNPEASRAAMVLRLFRTVMVLMILTGAVGGVLHYRANMEFKLEMDPSMSGLKLFWSVVRAKAPPAMAPAALMLLGLLGLTAAFRRRVPPRFATRQHQQE